MGSLLIGACDHSRPGCLCDAGSRLEYTGHQCCKAFVCEGPCDASVCEGPCDGSVGEGPCDVSVGEGPCDASVSLDCGVSPCEAYGGVLGPRS